MKAWEMENEAKRMLKEKFASRNTEPKPVADRYGSYDEAKAAADVAIKEGRTDRYAQEAMIRHKLNTYSGAVKRAQLDKLGTEYEVMSITDIQRQLKAATQEKAELDRYLDKVFDTEAKKAEKQYKGMGLISTALESAVAEHMRAWVKENTAYLEAQAQYNQADLKVIALRNAIDAFKVKNADLIEAAAEEKRKAEVAAYLASLEENTEEG